MDSKFPFLSKTHSIDTVEARMRKSGYIILSCILVFTILGLTGCAKESDTISDNQQIEMPLSEQSNADISVYGKTGMGKAQGIVVDSWYTGFADTADRRIYFCVYLGETDDKNVSSAKAREIAVEIVADYLL